MARSGLNLGSSGTGVRFCTVLPRSRRPRTSLQAAAEPAGAVRSAVWHSSSESLQWKAFSRCKAAWRRSLPCARRSGPRGLRCYRARRGASRDKNRSGFRGSHSGTFRGTAVSAGHLPLKTVGPSRRVSKTSSFLRQSLNADSSRYVHVKGFEGEEGVGGLAAEVAGEAVELR